jgi:hypothetical protein
MRARAERLGATFACQSRPGSGTTIEVTVPERSILEANGGQPVDAAPAASGSIRDG